MRANSRRTTSSLKQELFPAKQRGFYSDILREEAAGELKVIMFCFFYDRLYKFR